MPLFPTNNEQLWEELWLSAIKTDNRADFSKEFGKNNNKQNSDDAVKDDPIKNGDTGVSTVTNPVMSRL